MPSYAEVVLIHGHWPDTPLTSTSCEKIQALSGTVSDDAVSEVYYNAVLGLVLVTYRFADGTAIQTRWIVLDVAHEQAPDDSIKVEAHLSAYTIMFKDRVEVWVDVKGNGECKDFMLRSP